MKIALKCLVFFWFASFQVVIAAAEWTEYSNEEGGFSVEMPSKPEQQSLKQPIVGGQLEYHFAISQLKGGDQIFMISYNDYPAKNVEQTDPQIILDACVQGAVKSRRGKLVSEEKIKLNGHPGRDISFTGEADGEPLMVWHRCYLVENRLFQVMVMAKKENQPTQKDVQKFLTSFQLLESQQK
ncbi:MAG: hypothetical protein HUJ26_06635 [Planctomycetaceae bacterium]|nr:hypothetical protein [Planctomycetaceae bacterium]